MAGNTLLTIDMVTKEAVRLFKNSNLFIQNIDTQYDPAFANDGAKIGTSLRIRLPTDPTVTEGPALSLQNINETYVTLNVDTQLQVALAFTSVEKTMDIDDYSERYIAPATNNLAGQVAQRIMTKAAQNACNLVANFDAANANAILTPTMEQFLLANAVLDDNSADQMMRNMVNDPTTDARTTVGLSGLLNPTPEISAQYRTGMMKSGLGYNRWFRDQTVVKFTTGTFNAGGAVTTGGQTGTSITVSGITGTFNKGDIITIDGVNAVNPITKVSIGTLRQFVVTADVITAATVIPIFPAITPAGPGGVQSQYQTVDVSPLANAQVRLVTPASSVYRRSLAYVYKAITMASADLVLPKAGIVEGARAQYDGVSVRIITTYLEQSDQLATRMDLLFGSLTTRPQWCCIVADKI